MDAHATFISYDSVEEALEGRVEDSRSYMSLNGVWKFAWAENPEKRIKHFYARDYDASNWHEIAVPGHWQLQGYDYPSIRMFAIRGLSRRIYNRLMRQRSIIRSVLTSARLRFPTAGATSLFILVSKEWNRPSMFG